MHLFLLVVASRVTHVYNQLTDINLFMDRTYS